MQEPDKLGTVQSVGKVDKTAGQKAMLKESSDQAVVSRRRWGELTHEAFERVGQRIDVLGVMCLLDLEIEN